MRNFFVPYAGAGPAIVSIKGQNFVILSRDKLSLEDGLELLGADHLQEIVSEDSKEELTRLDCLAKQINGGVVVAPNNIDVGDIIVNLERQITWLQ